MMKATARRQWDADRFVQVLGCVSRRRRSAACRVAATDRRPHALSIPRE
jgi:hypothetical protein